jgi:hypothetical protein
MQIPRDQGSKTREEIRRMQNDGPMRAAMSPEFYEQKGYDDGVKRGNVCVNSEVNACMWIMQKRKNNGKEFPEIILGNLFIMRFFVPFMFRGNS